MLPNRLDECVRRMDALVRRFDDVDPRSREEKLRDLAARPGTKGEGEAAKAALARQQKMKGVSSAAQEYASQKHTAKSFGWMSSKNAPSTHYHSNGGMLHTGLGENSRGWHHQQEGYGKTIAHGQGNNSLHSHLSKFHGKSDDQVKDDDMTPTRADKPVSEAQRRAMRAAASGESNIGIPQSVGKEFSEKDPGGKLPARAKDDQAPPVKAAPYPNTNRPAFDAAMDALDAARKRFDDICDRTDFGGTYSGAFTPGAAPYDDDRSMNFPARRRDQGSGRQYGAPGRYDDDISAAGAHKAARVLARKGDPYKKSDTGARPMSGSFSGPRAKVDQQIAKVDAGRTAKAPKFEQPARRRASRMDDGVGEIIRSIAASGPRMDDDRVVHEVLARDRKRD